MNIDQMAMCYISMDSSQRALQSANQLKDFSNFKTIFQFNYTFQNKWYILGLYMRVKEGICVDQHAFYVVFTNFIIVWFIFLSISLLLKRSFNLSNYKVKFEFGNFIKLKSSKCSFNPWLMHEKSESTRLCYVCFSVAMGCKFLFQVN